MLLVLLLLLAISATAMDIVKDGKPCAQIIVDEQADSGTKLAAADLQKHIKLISGAELAITTQGQDGLAKIFVGDSAASKSAGYQAQSFSKSGYDIWVQGSCMFLNGPVFTHKDGATDLEKNFITDETAMYGLDSDNATLRNKELDISLADDCGPMHAVSAFLERLGVRFYAPYENGTVIPTMKDISVQDGRETKEAAFARREFQFGESQVTDQEGVLWLKRLKSGSSVERTGTLPLASVILGDIEKHPEWIAKTRQGKPYMTRENCGMPHYLDPSFQEACVARLRSIFDASPNLKKVMLIPPGGIYKFDPVEFNSQYKGMSYWQPIENEIIFTFISKVSTELKKTHPGKDIVWQYPQTGDILSEEYLANIPQNSSFAFNAASASFSYADGKYIKKCAKMMEGMPMFKFQQREWWNDYSWQQTKRQPYFFMHGLQAARIEQRKGGTEGFLMDLAEDKVAGRLAEVNLMHLMTYVNSKLLWDPELDLDALLNEYYSLWYGPAAEKIHIFHDYAAEVASRKGTPSFAGQDSKCQPIDVQVYAQLLSEADSLVPQDSIYHSRIASIEQSIAWLKDAENYYTPKGDPIQSEILPLNTANDGNLDKYKNWYPLLDEKGKVSKKNATEVAIAFDDNRARLFVAFRCKEDKMSKLSYSVATDDDMNILKCEHVAVTIATNTKNHYMIAANPDGNFVDVSYDLRNIQNFGSALGWNPYFTQVKTSKTAQGWTTELAIDISGFGKGPDYGDAWAINASRVRFVSGKAETFAFSQSETPATWRQLNLKNVNAAGEEVTKHGCIIRKILPDMPDPYVYTVKKAHGPVDFAAGWDGGAWKDANELRLGYEMYVQNTSSGFYPDTRAKILYDDEFIYVHYQVKDQYVRGGISEDNDMVCTDSCVEIFFQPSSQPSYFNFEANCTGTLLIYKLTPVKDGRDGAAIDQEDMESIERFSTLPKGNYNEITTPTTWRMGLKIPVAFFVKYANTTLPLTRQVWDANVFKCADRTSHPTWLIWHKAWTFHAPEDFGKFIFE